MDVVFKKSKWNSGQVFITCLNTDGKVTVKKQKHKSVN